MKPNVTCPSCAGAKTVKKYVGGFFRTYQYVACDTCDGSGRVEHYCLGCEKALSWYGVDQFCVNEDCERFGLSSVLTLRSRT
jgi:hypothetical protein